MTSVLSILFFWLVLTGLSHAAIPVAEEKIHPFLRSHLTSGEPLEAIISLREQSSLNHLNTIKERTQRAQAAVDQLKSTAQRTQAALLSWLRENNIEHRSYWISNAIWIKASATHIKTLAEREDIAYIHANPKIQARIPLPRTDNNNHRGAIEWNITQVNAPDVWAMGITGQGVTIGGQDTGYQWNHPGLQPHYRGWDGVNANHDYNWHDAIHSGGGSCGADTTAPCDDHGHGTHTMGSMVGDDGAGNQVGMAPGADWIGCRNMNVGNGTPATYMECFEWFVAPTDINGLNPDPGKAPHVINNSWGCPPDEGCTDTEVLHQVVQNVRAAGIVVVVSAGNSGPGCGSVDTPAPIYAESFSVAATNSSDGIASFSSRGPVTVDGSNRPKPEISAPGVGIRSTTQTNSYGNSSGTSMAGPHVAGLVALIIAANPSLAGDVDAIEGIIRQTAVPQSTTQDCGGTAGQIPNNVYGWGRIDALAAVNMAMTDVVYETGFETVNP